MSAVHASALDLASIEAELRVMTGGFGVEMAVAWPVLHDRLERPVIASVGTERRVRLMPERVFRYALRVGAAGVVLAHNHLTNTGPSAADLAVTRRLVAAGHLLGVTLLAHLVVEPDAVHELVGGVVSGRR